MENSWIDLKLRPQTRLSAKSESEGTIEFASEPRKMVIIIARRWRWTWEGVPMAIWCREWICRIGWGLVHHIVNIPHTLSLLPLRDAAVGCAPPTLAMDRFCTRFSSYLNSAVFPATRVIKKGSGFSKRTCIFGGIQFIRHLIEFVVVETKQTVSSNSNVILTRQTDRSPFTSQRESNPRHGTKGLSYDNSFIPLGHQSTYRNKPAASAWAWLREANAKR